MGDVSRNGIFQGDLVTLILAIKTALNAIATQLDSDTGVGKATYNSLWAMTAPDERVESQGTGLGQGDLYDFLNQFFTSYNGIIAQLNGDSGVADTNYAALTSNVGENKAIFAGMNQTDLITDLQAFITGIATLTAKLDSDTGVADTSYADNDVTDTVDDSGQ